MGLYFGPEIMDRSPDSDEVAGFIDAAISEPGEVTLIPTIRAITIPGGPVEAETFAYFKRELITRIKDAGQVDGVLFSFHGAMVAEGIDDCEGTLLSAIRETVGPRIPISISLDLHGNIPSAMVEQANIICGYHTSPHTDHFDIGRKAARLLFATLKGECTPVCRWRRIPHLVHIQKQNASLPGPYASL